MKGTVKSEGLRAGGVKWQRVNALGNEPVWMVGGS